MFEVGASLKLEVESELLLPSLLEKLYALMMIGYA